MPSVDIVDMREELRSGNRSMFSTMLFEKMKNRLEKGEQIVLFLNKRGHSSLLCAGTAVTFRHVSTVKFH